MDIFEKVLFLGDAVPKINFICDLISEAHKVQFRDWINTPCQKVILHSCECNSLLERTQDIIWIGSQWIPQGVEITVLFENLNWTSDIYDQVIFIQPYPFTLNSFNQELEKIRTNLFVHSRLKITSYKVMFYRDFMQQSVAGESDDIESVLQNAPNQLEKELKKELDGEMIAKLLQYRIYRDPRNIISILHGSNRLLRATTELSIEHLQNLKDSLEIFSEDYGEYQSRLLYYEELTSENLNSLTRFENVKGCSDVSQRYLELYCDAYEDKICCFAKEVYESIIRPVCFWNLERDIDNLEIGIRELLHKELTMKSLNSIPCPPDKMKYNQIIRNQYAYDTTFLQEAHKFIKSTLMKYIYKILKEKERLLSVCLGPIKMDGE